MEITRIRCPDVGAVGIAVAAVVADDGVHPSGHAEGVEVALPFAQPGEDLLIGGCGHVGGDEVDGRFVQTPAGAACRVGDDDPAGRCRGGLIETGRGHRFRVHPRGVVVGAEQDRRPIGAGLVEDVGARVASGEVGHRPAAADDPVIRGVGRRRRVCDIVPNHLQRLVERSGGADIAGQCLLAAEGRVHMGIDESGREQSAFGGDRAFCGNSCGAGADLGDDPVTDAHTILGTQSLTVEDCDVEDVEVHMLPPDCIVVAEADRRVRPCVSWITMKSP